MNFMLADNFMDIHCLQGHMRAQQSYCQSMEVVTAGIISQVLLTILTPPTTGCNVGPDNKEGFHTWLLNGGNTRAVEGQVG